MEEHNKLCTHCGYNLGPCTEPSCINRYDHADGLCNACRAREERAESDG